MPRMDGFEALCAIRAYEEEAGIIGKQQQAKIIITTGLNDSQTVLTSFRRQCDAFIRKPITKDKIETEMKQLGLI